MTHVDPVARTDQAARTDQTAWTDLLARVAAELRALRPGTFLVVEYQEVVSWEQGPYAQCVREADSWYCEVVSEHYLPRDAWPIDELALRRTGWLRPDGETDNWWLAVETCERAAAAMVAGLRSGRRCPNPDAFCWRVGTFPSGPDEGEPMPVPASLAA